MNGVRGNPTVLLPRSQIARWPGASAIPKSPKEWALAARGDGFAGLALNSPEQTIWFPRRDGGVLLQCACVPDDMDTDEAQELFRRVVAKLPTSGWKRGGFTYTAVDNDSILFDGGFTGSELGDPKTLEFMDDEGIGRPLPITLPTGTYTIDVLAPFAAVADANSTCFGSRSDRRRRRRLRVERNQSARPQRSRTRDHAQVVHVGDQVLEVDAQLRIAGVATEPFDVHRLRGPHAAMYRVLRGGNFSDPPTVLRAADRIDNLPPSTRLIYLGVRCARTP